MSENRVEKWENEYWNKDLTPWQMSEANPSLVKNWYRATGGQPGLRVLLPLCGASKDLGWLYRQGHTVLGVEGSRKAVERLFTEEQLEYQVDSPAKDVWVFSTTDTRLSVYVMDFFQVTTELIGRFDAVFDRGSLEALEEKDRAQYISIVASCLKDQFSYILSGFDYDPALKPGPPRPLPPNTVQTLFGSFATVETLSREEPQAERQRWNLPSLAKFTFLLRRKDQE